MRVILALGLICTFANLAKCGNGRQLQLTLNPNCTEKCHPFSNYGEPVNLVYVRADGENDTLHYLWSSRGTFACLIFKSSTNASLYVDWTSLTSDHTDNSIRLTEKPLYKRAILITKVWEFSDADDNANIESVKSTDEIIGHKSYDFSWDTLNTSVVSVTYESAAVGYSLLPVETNSNPKHHPLQIHLSAFGKEGRASTMPRLRYDQDIMHLNLVINNFVTRFNQSRFGLELAIVKSKGSPFQMEISDPKTLDDEYTPGVFRVIQLSTTGNESDYLQWKPVSYTSDDLTTEHSTACNAYHVKDGNVTEEILNSVVRAALDIDEIVVKKINISFGITGDGFYQNYNYLTWSVAIGIGSPPKDKFSFMVILVIIVGFGLPTALIVAGGIILLWRRFIVRKVKESDEMSAGLIN